MTLPDDVKLDLARFHKYLRECDAAWILETRFYSFPTFGRLRESIEKVAHPPDYEGPSNLTGGYGASAEKFAAKLGKALIAHGMEQLRVHCAFHQNDWQTLQDYAQLCELGHNIQYFNQDC